MGAKPCSVAGCDRAAVAKGLCKPHYDMKRDHGRTDYVPVLMNTTRCAAEGCTELARQKGLCDKHYQRLRKYGDPNHYPAKPQVNGGPCSVPGCSSTAATAGMCKAHYAAMQRHGDPTIVKANRVRRPCSVEGCDKLTTRTYCNAHEKRFKRYGSVEKMPPRGRRSFHGPCAEIGCGKVATKTGRCEHHSRTAVPGTLGARPMLTIADIAYIRATPDQSAQQVADRLQTTPRTVVAIRGGRNWGWRA